MSNHKLEPFLFHLAHYGQEISSLAATIQNDLSLFNESERLYEHVTSMHRHACDIVLEVNAAVDQIHTTSEQADLAALQALVANTYLTQQDLWQALYEMAAPLKQHTEKIHIGMLFISIVEALDTSYHTLQKMANAGNQYIKSSSKPANWFTKWFTRTSVSS